MRYSLTSDDILLVVQGEYNLCGVLKVIDWGVCGEEIVPEEEQKLQEGSELDYPAMAFVIGVFPGPKV